MQIRQFLFFFLSLVLVSPVFSEEVPSLPDAESLPTPIFVLAPQMQADFLPSPFPRTEIAWDSESAKKLIIDSKEGLILFLSGKLTDANLYLADFKLPTDRGKFQFHLPLTTSSGSFLFMLHQLDAKCNSKHAGKAIVKCKLHAKGLDIAAGELLEEIIMVMLHFSNLLKNAPVFCV